jgi:hypothetical protein
MTRTPSIDASSARWALSSDGTTLPASAVSAMVSASISGRGRQVRRQPLSRAGMAARISVRSVARLTSEPYPK